MSEIIQKLQSLDQNLQMLRTQVHSVKSTLLETTTAQKAIAQKTDAYTFVGNIMIKCSVSELDAELSAKKELLERKLQSFQEQEAQLVATKKELENTLLGDQNE